MAVTRRSILSAPLAWMPALRAEQRTNVVMFMTDDHGAWAMGAYGCREMRTPNLDQLASEGARFTRAYACTPVCSPSRMSYLTGAVPSQHGVQDWLVPEDSFGPHRPSYFQPDRYRESYLNTELSCFPDEEMHPWLNAGLAQNHVKRESKLAYSALITGVDYNVGRILRRLERLKLRENTLVIFT